MKKIEVSFLWSDLDESSKRRLFSTVAPWLPMPNYPFERANDILTWVNCEFVMFLDGGVAALRLSDQTRDKVKTLIRNAGQNN